MSEDSGKRKIRIEGASVTEKKVNAKVMLQFGAVAAIVIAVMLISYFSKTEPQQRERPLDQNEEIGIEFKSIQEADWATKMQAEMNRMSRNIEQVKRDNETLLRERAKNQREIAALRDDLTRQGMNPTIVRESDDDEATIVGDDGSVPPPRRPGERERVVDQTGVVPPPPAPRDQRADAVGRNPPMPPRGGERPERPAPPSAPEPVVVTGAPMREGVVADRTFVENEFAGYLPAGSFSAAVMLHGVDAGASESTRANPQPVIMRINGAAITPGDSTYEMDSCFAIGNAVGELSSERAMIRVSRVSCLDESQGFVLEATVDGFVIDSDGMQGLRGKVVRRSGQVIAKATLAGIAEGFGAIAGAAAQTNSRSFTGSQIGGGVFGTQERVDAGELARAGALGGVQNSAGLIADFYLREAESIFPVISIPPGRKISIAFLRGQSLRWQRYEGLFRERIDPE